MQKVWQINKKALPLQTQLRNNGTIAQLVEQRTENPCVPGSIPGGTTVQKEVYYFQSSKPFFVYSLKLFVIVLSWRSKSIAFRAQKGCFYLLKALRLECKSSAFIFQLKSI